jgi:hypothetical protein
MSRQSVMFLVPIETRTTENQRSGTSRWAKAPKNRSQRTAVMLAARHRAGASQEWQLRLPLTPWVVRLTRIHPPRHKLDDDNVQAALKAVRDAVAEDVLGLPSDRDRRVTFLYAQRPGERWGVEVEVMGPCEVVTTVRDVTPWPIVEDPDTHAARLLRENGGIPGSNDDDVAGNMAAVEGERDG